MEKDPVETIFDNSILLVDDEKDFRESMARKIKRAVTSVYEAENGCRALEIISRKDIEVVFLDLNMPYMDGLTLLKKIRESSPDIINIIMTAYGDMESVKTALKLGAYDFLEKPVEREYMMSCLKRAIEKVDYEKTQRELIEILLYKYSSISPEKFKLLPIKEKNDVLRGTLSLMKVKVLNKKY